MARNGLAETEVRAILKAQASREQRLEIADDVIDNAAEMTNLYPSVAELHLKYLALSSEKAKANC
jgi:dephospho-CoA kinase